MKVIDTTVYQCDFCPRYYRRKHFCDTLAGVIGDFQKAIRDPDQPNTWLKRFSN